VEVMRPNDSIRVAHICRSADDAFLDPTIDGERTPVGGAENFLRMRLAPRPQPAYGGQLRLRMPKSLHQAMAVRADQEGVSLNALALTFLSRGIGT